MPNSHQNAREIFTACRRAATPEERAKIIDRECGDNALLRERVENLLSAREADGKNLLEQIVAGRDEESGPDLNATQSYDLDEFESGTFERTTSSGEEMEISQHPMIGPYKQLQEIGQGGMGTVYMAQQSEPIQRNVALKIIKPGMDSKEVLARFEAERQVLAMMDHPSIAKVLDGGSTDSGRPYFVMELVHGTPITTFCDEAKLSTRQRLELFAHVCRAVQHAHLKGVIHRDLKPSNVLVTMNDDKPLPKVIDFGVAKALASPLTDKTLFTAYGQMVGTPLYMSPEQAQMSARDVDVRSDVYSLGVLLYELLTGSTPFDKETLKKSGFDGMRRMILEVDPPPPSARVSTLGGNQLPTISAQRRIDAKKFSQLLKGELDWIVMKALEKDRDQRYESASAFAQDVERHLNREPVQAGPHSWGYYLKKQVDRHRSIVLSAILLLVAILVGIASSVWYAIQADEALQLADGRLIVAERERAKAERANQQFGSLLYAADMKLASDAIANGDTPRAVELLERHAFQDGLPDLRGFEWSFFKKQATQLPDHSIDLDVWVNDVALSPNGDRLAVGLKGGSIRIFEVDSWREFGSFWALSASVGGVAWSPDGKSLAGAYSNGMVCVWDVRTGKKRITIPAHVGGANDVVFGKNGRSLFSSGEDHLAKQWNIESGELETEFKTHQRAVGCMALSPDGKRLATISRDDTFAVWDVATANKLYQSQNDEGRYACLAFAMDGRVAAGDIHGHVSIHDYETGKAWQLPRQLDGVEGLTFFKNGTWLATADRGGAIQLHPLDGNPDDPDHRLPILGEPLRWIAHDGRAVAITATADGKQLITGGRDGRVRVWSPDVQALRWYVYSDHATAGFALASNDRFYVAGRCITAWNLASRRQDHVFAPASPAWSYLAASQDGRWLAAVRRDQLALFDGQTHEKTQSWPHTQDGKPHRMAISPDGQFIALCGIDERTVQIFSRGRSDKKHELPASQCNALAFSPDGRWLAAGHMDDLRLFDLNTDGEFRSLKGHSNSLAGVSFSPDGKWVATVSHDRLLKIWSLPDGRETFSIVAHHDRVRAVAFSPDGRTIATAGDDGQVKFWHTATGQPLGALPPEERRFSSLQFTPDGQRLVGMLDRAKIVIYDTSHITRTPTNPSRIQPVLKFSRMGNIPDPSAETAVGGMSRNGKFVTGQSYTDKGCDGLIWSDEGLRSLPIYKNDRRLDSIAKAVSDDGRVIGQGAPGAFVRQDGGPAVSIGPRQSFANDMTPDGHFIVGETWESDRWYAFRRQGGQTTIFPSSPKHKHTLAVAITPTGSVVLGRAVNTVNSPERLSLLFSDRMRNAQPVIWKEQRLEFLEGFDDANNWWPIGFSDDARVVVGVTWPQGHNFFSGDDYRSGVTFRWEAGEVTLLGTLANHQHSQPFAISGDGRIIVGSCFCKRGHGLIETAFIWDIHHGMRPLKDVLIKAGVEIRDWEIHRAVAISRDGTTIAGNGVNPNGQREGWVVKCPRGFFDVPHHMRKQPLETPMKNTP